MRTMTLTLGAMVWFAALAYVVAARLWPLVVHLQASL